MYKFVDLIKIGILGLGTMGWGWVQTLAEAGYEIFVWEPSEGIRQKNYDFIRKNLGKLVEKAKKPAGYTEEVMARIHLLQSQEAMPTGIQLLFEIIKEDFELKKKVFEYWGEVMPEDVIFATNTSCLDVEEMAEASGRPGQFIGLHGMNPVPLMPGVEVVIHDLINPEVLDFGIALVKKVGKTPLVSNNVPGFIVNDLLIPLMLRACWKLQNGDADTKTIDEALRQCLGHPQGILMLADRVGIDVLVLVADDMYDRLEEDCLAVPEFVYEMVKKGYLGVKAGRGFYDWTDPKNPTPIAFDQLTA